EAVKLGAARNKTNADQFAANTLPIIREIQASGVTTLRGVARALTARGVPSARARPGRRSRWRTSSSARRRRHDCTPPLSDRYPNCSVAPCATGSPHRAEATEPEMLTLACEGTGEPLGSPSYPPFQASLRIIVDFAPRHSAAKTELSLFFKKKCPPQCLH